MTMPDTENDILHGQFSNICDALDMEIPYSEFKKKLLAAYSVTESVVLGIEDPAEALAGAKEKELEFAKQCLEGRGPNANQVFRETGDLREVLLIEIGTHRRRPKSPARPWLMGDWQILAERIVEAILNSEGYPGSTEIKRHESREVVRVWPTRSNWKDVGNEVLSKGSQVEVGLKKRPDVGNKGLVTVRARTKSWGKDEYNWIVLPTGAGVLAYPDGIPAHLWTGFRVDDGT